MSIHLDLETSSPCDLFKLGGHKYAAHPETRTLILAVARDEEDVKVWDIFNGGEEALEIIDDAIDDDELIYAHNISFEAAMFRYRAGLDFGLPSFKIENGRCTAAMCRRAAIPPALGKACEFLRFEDGKGKEGKALINLFSKTVGPASAFTIAPPEGVTTKKFKTSDPIALMLKDKSYFKWTTKVSGEVITLSQAFDKFKAYCVQDVIVERKLHKKLKHFELKGDILESFQFNLRMNDFGSPVNRKALLHVQTLIEEYQGRVGTRFENLTGFRATQVAKLTIWFREHGYHEENLQADTVTRVIADNDMDAKGKTALPLLKLLKFAALTKFPTMIAAQCPDGTIQGSTLWHGARTGRATGRIHQPHNMKKATMDTSLAYQMIEDGAPLEDFEEFWESPLEIFACCARHFIQHPTLDFLDADYTGVEARITPWIAGDEKKLASILSGIDQYKSMGAQIFNKPIEEITKDERTTSKPVELGCCFGVGGLGLKNSLRDDYGVALTLKECKRIVKVYRDGHPETVEAWAAVELAAKKAILQGTTSSILQDRVQVRAETHAQTKYLVIELPSGRGLYYPWPRIKKIKKKYTKAEMLEEAWKAEKKFYITDEIQFYGTRPGTSIWGWVGTWGSRLFENIVQSIGADLLEAGCVEAEKQGFNIFAVIHDQALALAEEGKSLEGFIKALCHKNPWAETFPLEADGRVAPYYRKD